MAFQWDYPSDATGMKNKHDVKITGSCSTCSMPGKLATVLVSLRASLALSRDVVADKLHHSDTSRMLYQAFHIHSSYLILTTLLRSKQCDHHLGRNVRCHLSDLPKVTLLINGKAGFPTNRAEMWWYQAWHVCVRRTATGDQ